MRNWVMIILAGFAIACSNKEDVTKLNFLKKGNTAYENGNWSEAIRYYNEAIGQDSAFVDAWNNRGLAEMGQRNYDAAIFSFNRALKIKQDYTDAILNNARANLAVHQHYAALEQVDDLNKLWPDSSLIFFTRGLIYYDMEDREAAMNNFRIAYNRDTLNSEALINMANIFYENNAFDSALVYLKQALRLNADEPNAYNILAMTYVGLNEYDQALDAINTAGSLNDMDAFIINNKGYILLLLEREDESESYFIKSMKIDPYNAYVYRNIGLLRLNQENYTEAVRMLEKAESIDNTIEDLYLELAQAHFGMGNSAKACELIKQYTGSDKVSLESQYCR